MFCEYCNNEFKSRSALNNHQQKAVYCLVIQGKMEKKDKDDFMCNLCLKTLSNKNCLKVHKQRCEGAKERIFKCEFCDKILSSKQNLEIHNKKCELIKEKEEFKCEYCEKILSTKQMLINHKNICSVKKDNEIQKKVEELKDLKEKTDKELKEKEEIIIKIKTQNENYKEQNKNYKEQVKELQDKLDKIANKAIDRPTTMTNNTTLNIASFIDFNDIDKIKNTIENRLNINHVVDGQKGLANFVKDNLLTDDTGKLLYICTDPSRNIFKYKDSTGEVKKDVEAKKLTNYILEGGIRTKSAVLGNEWCKDDKGDINIDRFNVMLEQQQSIMKLSDDNNNFKKELASITTT